MKKTLISLVLILTLLTSGFVLAAKEVSGFDRVAESLGIELSILESETSEGTALKTIYVETTAEEVKNTLTALKAELEAVKETLEPARYVFLLIDAAGAPLYVVSVDQSDAPLIELSAAGEAGTGDDGDVEIGQTFATNTLEFTLNSVEIVDKVLPPDTSGFHTYYEAAEGKRYVFVDLNVKNLGKEEIKFSELYTPTLIYDDGYTYRGQILVLRDQKNFSYANINNLAPLANEFASVMFEVPEEVETSDKAVVITFMAGDSLFRYRYR